MVCRQNCQKPDATIAETVNTVAQTDKNREHFTVVCGKLAGDKNGSDIRQFSSKIIIRQFNSTSNVRQNSSQQVIYASSTQQVIYAN